MKAKSRVLRMDKIRQLAYASTPVYRISLIEAFERESQTVFQRLMCLLEIWAAIDSGEVKCKGKVLPRCYRPLLNILLYIKTL